MAKASHGSGSPARVLAVFARYPAPGRVKTRLAAAIGEVAAADLYAAFVADLAGSLVDPSWATQWWIAPPDAGFAQRFRIDPAGCREQRGHDLGDRMRFAFASARSDGFERSVLVGSDMPHLGRDRVIEAFARLDEADLVLGPADDGGYYLIAMREPAEVFSGVAWSTSRVLDQTIDHARRLGLRVALLEPGFDVDAVADLERLRALLREPGAEGDLPHTARALRTQVGALPHSS